MPDDDRMTARPMLAAVDFSVCSEAALAWAASEARLHGATLIVLHVVHDPSDEPGYYRRQPEDAPADSAPPGTETMESVGARYLERFMEEFGRANDDIRHVRDVRTRLVVGLPATRILEVAHDEDVDHIVMGSRGRTGIAHLLVGSIAQRVVQLSPIPVTIVKAEQHPVTVDPESAAS